VTGTPGNGMFIIVLQCVPRTDIFLSGKTMFLYFLLRCTVQATCEVAHYPPVGRRRILPI
jgi:hypothetical protein